MRRLVPIALLLAASGPARAGTWDCRASIVMEEAGGTLTQMQGPSIPPGRGRYVIDTDHGLVAIGDAKAQAFRFEILRQGSADADTVMAIGDGTRIAVRPMGETARFSHIHGEFDFTYGICSPSREVLADPGPEADPEQAQ